MFKKNPDIPAAYNTFIFIEISFSIWSLFFYGSIFKSLVRVTAGVQSLPTYDVSEVIRFLIFQYGLCAVVWAQITSSLCSIGRWMSQVGITKQGCDLCKWLFSKPQNQVHLLFFPLWSFIHTHYIPSTMLFTVLLSCFSLYLRYLPFKHSYNAGPTCGWHRGSVARLFPEIKYLVQNDSQYHILAIIVP